MHTLYELWKFRFVMMFERFGVDDFFRNENNPFEQQGKQPHISFDKFEEEFLNDVFRRVTFRCKPNGFLNFGPLVKLEMMIAYENRWLSNAQSGRIIRI